MQNRAQKLMAFGFRQLPVLDRTIFFESHRGLSYSGNPKAISEAVQRLLPEARCVWSFVDTSLETPAGIIKVKKGSPDYYRYHSRAKVLVHNGEFGQQLPIRREQVYINTQHGTPLKLMGSDIARKRGKDVGKEYSRTNRWSWLVSPNRYSTEIFTRVFDYQGPVLEVGYPRNDIFYNRNDPNSISSIKAKYGVPEDRRVLLYAPTWRDVAGARVERGFALKLDLSRLYDRFGRSHVLLLRLHHLIASKLELSGDLANFAFDVSSAEFDAQELMLISDALITDYSSMMFDYANLKRPMIFYAYDLDEYENDIRGMYFSLEAEAPGPVVRDMDGILEAISNLQESQAVDESKRERFLRKFCANENGRASEQVVERLIAPALCISPATMKSRKE